MVPATRGISLFAIPVIGWLWAKELHQVGKAGDIVQKKSEELFHVQLEEKIKPMNDFQVLGTTVKFSSQPFFTLSSSIQSMPIFNQFSGSTPTSAFQTSAPISLHCNLPAPTLPLKTAPTPTPSSSTATMVAKLSPQQSALQAATLLKEKQQTELYFKQQQFTVKQALVPAAVALTKSPANYGSVASHSVLTSASSHSVVTSSGGTVTSGNGSAVTTSNEPNVWSRGDRGTGGDYSRRGW